MYNLYATKNCVFKLRTNFGHKRMVDVLIIKINTYSWNEILSAFSVSRFNSKKQFTMHYYSPTNEERVQQNWG